VKDKIPRITVQELKKRMDEEEPVFIVDVRRQRDENRIAGAVSYNPDAILEAGKFELPVPKDRFIVTY
jgi:rhodanese-related sulfurtransferase